eukprot:371208_1
MPSAFNWRFAAYSQEILAFKQAKPDAVLQSEKFDYNGYRFYLECTPNGYSSQGLPEGDCILWLAIDKLPDDVKGIKVTFRFVCDEINYSASRICDNMGLGGDRKYSSGTLDTSKLSAYKYKSSWTFKCFITINEVFKKTADDKAIGNGLGLKEMLLLLSLIGDKDKDKDDEKNEIKNVAQIRYPVGPSYHNKELVLTYFYGQNKYYFHIEPRPFANGYFKISYKATLFKSETKQSHAPNIADGTSVVLKVKKAVPGPQRGSPKPTMSRGDWRTELNELNRLEKYAKEWNKNRYSDKTYHVSQAVVLKVSDESSSGTCMFVKDEYILVEPYMPSFDKWNWPSKSEKDAKSYSIQAFGHFTYHKSNGKELVNDAQGYRDDNKYILTDPYYLDLSNSSHKSAARSWFEDHECNRFCKTWWKRPIGIQKRNLRSNGATGYLNNYNGRRVRKTEPV